MKNRKVIQEVVNAKDELEVVKYFEAKRVATEANMLHKAQILARVNGCFEYIAIELDNTTLYKYQCVFVGYVKS